MDKLGSLVPFLLFVLRAIHSNTMLSSSRSIEVWQAAVEHTKGRSPATFEKWFSGVQFDRFDHGVLELTARDEFVRDWVKAHFLPDLLEHIQNLGGDALPQEVRVEWRVDGKLQSPVCLTPRVEPRSPNSERAPARNRTAPLSTPPRSGSVRPAPRLVEERANPVWDSLLFQLNLKYTFDNFVVGPSNELAYAAARASAGGTGPRYNPLFIAGGTGLGKTHLMHAIAHRMLEQRPSAKIIYVSAERFTNEFIEALQHHAMDGFRARYRNECDLLLVDDIQFLAGREQTQEEFFHTFNALRDVDKPIVVTSDKYPQQLQRMPERLVSRFTSGLVADVQVPKLETRVAIVKKKAALEGILLPDSVAVLLAQTIQNNVRELEGALIRLAAKSSLTGHPVDEAFARSELAIVAPQSPDLMSVEDIQRAVCGHFRLTSAELLSKDRHKSIAFARQVAMYLCRQRLKCSFPELGRAFGNRDHTTVMSAVRRVEALRARDPQVNAHLEAIEKRLTTAGES